TRVAKSNYSEFEIHLTGRRKLSHQEDVSQRTTSAEWNSSSLLVQLGRLKSQEQNQTDSSTSGIVGRTRTASFSSFSKLKPPENIA
ncbi:hypothetical protein CDAR_12221, partial [Caerostris darwini]